ncbi:MULTISPECIES: amidohydrolase family protein [Bacillus]|uniref:amidohydrolase family protein n=1 Tax=Bacillus TaxID=1386 RepID=UPI001D0D2B8F|nr:MULTISPECIES: amidohydrolase family protein [Bacillus]
MKEKTILLKNGYVVDVESGSVREQDILMKHGKIAALLPVGTTIDNFSDMKIFDISGKWIIPGLIDMHVHIKDAFAPIFTAAGITTVRNTGGNVLELRSLIEAPRDAPTPKIVSADRIMDGPPGLWGETSPWSINIDTKEEAIKEVKRQVEAGAEFVKVYGWLSREVMEATVEEAKKHGKEVSCDLLYSTDVNAVDAAKIGVKWNEHVSGVVQAMYPSWNMRAEQSDWDEINWEKPDEELIRNICLELLKYDVILCPTMILFDQQGRVPDVWKPDNEVIEKIQKNEGLIQQWSMISQYVDALKKNALLGTINKRFAKTYAELGGRVVAGTDTPAGVWTYPGMALHRELELFVKAGFTKLEALRAATSMAAASLNKPELGIIQKGAIADLVVLNANPLENIENTKEINLIIKGGKVYTQLELLNAVPSEEEVNKKEEEFLAEFNVKVLKKYTNITKV